MSDLENKRRFTFHFTQRYVELRGGYDIQKEDVFAGIVDKYFKLSKRIPPDDYAQFLAGITEREFKDDGYSWTSAAARFISDKYPTPKREEPEKTGYLKIGDPSVKMFLRAHRHKMEIPIGRTKRRELVFAIRMYRIGRKYNRFVDKSYLYLIREATRLEKKEAIHAIRQFDKRDRMRGARKE